jgi:hypothetical protein
MAGLTGKKAIQAASEKFTIAKGDVRLTCAAKDMPWIGAYASGQDVYM